ncbi:hypothetical protein LCGC14_0451130 [marine sediment metagenome]|uniref:DNA methylase N-4/N-6 domain-containing protein n=1 Tax=marine sediment metagenome TaxID=412755 RepID=A0A0F9T120_9ZZZZ
MKFCYADPPYPGCEKHYGGRGVNHKILIWHLEHDFDAFALSTNQKNLAYVLPMLTCKYRIMAWVKTFGGSMATSNPSYYWEPVIVHGGRKRRPREYGRLDWCEAHTYMHELVKQQVVGKKPNKFYHWLLDVVNVKRGDEVIDLFPGNGGLSHVVDSHMNQQVWPLETEISSLGKTQLFNRGLTPPAAQPAEEGKT